MKNQVKCYSVRLQGLTSISEKAYKATGFDGSSAIIPKSQVFGQDYDVQKSEAYWIGAWILEQKELQYSKKKASFFDKGRADYIPETGVEIERHVPEEKEVIDIDPIAELIKEPSTPRDNRQFVLISPCYSANGYHGSYVSYAETNTKGDFTRIDGDHFFGTGSGPIGVHTIEGFITNVFDLDGYNYSDDNRPVRIKEVNCDATLIKDRAAKIQVLRAEQEAWEAAKPQIRWAKTKKDKYIEDADMALVIEYRKANPYPKEDFLSYEQMCDFLISLK